MSNAITDDNTKHLDPLATAANTAWLEYAKGTWSETDRRIFMEGFHRGVQYRQAQEDRKTALSVERKKNWGNRLSEQ